MVHYLNDAQEFRYAIGLTRSILYNRRQHAPNSSTQEFYARFSDSLERIERVHICVFSLSEQRNLLSQWRSYCPATGGYALGFQTASLKPILANHGFVLLPCTYDHSQQQALLNDVLDGSLGPVVRELGTSAVSVDQAIEAALAALVPQFAPVAAIIKHPSFSEEREWRLISSLLPSDHPTLRFRPGNGLLIPYYELALDGADAPFGHVVIGPSPNQQLAMDSLTVFLTRLGIKWKGIENSRIPFRVL